MKTRICFFAGSMNHGGGTERMTQLLANALANDENYEVYILSKSDKGEDTYYSLDSRIIYQVLDNSPFRGIASLAKDIVLLAKYVKQNRIAIFINVDVSIGFFSLPLTIICPSLKQIYWEHFSIQYSSDNRRMERLRKLALKCGDAYVTLTPEDAVDVKKKVRKHCKVLDIPNICTYQQSLHPYDIVSKRIISVGNMLKVKGFDYALQVAEKVFQKHPDWNWFFYGDGRELEALKKQALKLNISDKVHFMGRLKDISSAYEQASMFVLPSRTEGFGLVLVEAQAHHLPTVAFDVPYGPRNIIAHQKNGFLIEPFNIDAMAEAICELIENTSIRVEFSHNATSELNKYTLEDVVVKWKRLMEEL